jgi:hypothetical protein
MWVRGKGCGERGEVYGTPMNVHGRVSVAEDRGHEVTRHAHGDQHRRWHSHASALARGRPSFKGAVVDRSRIVARTVQAAPRRRPSVLSPPARTRPSHSLVPVDILMKLPLLALALAATATTSDAIRIPVKRSRTTALAKRSGSGSISVTNPSASLSRFKVLASGGSSDNDGLDLRWAGY